MNKNSTITTPVESNVTDWMRELWEVEAKHPATVGSRLKFGLPLTPAKPKRRKTSTAKRPATRV